MKCDVDSAGKGSERRSGIRSAKSVADDLGVSAVTIWRWGRMGYLKIVRVANRPFVDLESLARFQSDAMSGRFTTELAGAAKQSESERIARETAKENEPAHED